MCITAIKILVLLMEGGRHVLLLKQLTLVKRKVKDREVEELEF